MILEYLTHWNRAQRTGLNLFTVAMIGAVFAVDGIFELLVRRHFWNSADLFLSVFGTLPKDLYVDNGALKAYKYWQGVII